LSIAATEAERPLFASLNVAFGSGCDFREYHREDLELALSGCCSNGRSAPKDGGKPEFKLTRYSHRMSLAT